MRYKTVFITLLIFYLIATVFGLFNVLGGNFDGIAWVFAPLGIFIWGDALILGPFLAVASGWLLFKNKPIWDGLFFSTFVAVRSFVEISYSLNAQFSATSRPWELNWNNLAIVKSIGFTEMFVLSQLVFTCIFIISTLSFIHFLKQYLKS